MTKLTIALQKSGRLAEKSLNLLRRVGFEFEISPRGLVANCTNFPLEIIFLRASDIPEIVFDKTADLGICGQDSVEKKGFKTIEIEKFGFGTCRLSIAVPDGDAFECEKMGVEKFLENKRIATSYKKIVQKYLLEKNIKAEVVELSGSVEIAPKLGVADAIADLVSTGSTMKMNGLKEVLTIFKSESILFSSQEKFENPEKQELFEKFIMRLRAVLRAKKSKYVVMNLERKNLEKFEEIFQGLKSPTITNLADEKWVSVATVIEENIFWETIEKLKEIGAEGILVMPIEKIIL